MTAATAKVYRKDTLTSVEAEFMAREVPGQFKITMMSAAMGGMVWHPAVSSAAYPSPAELMQDLVALQIEEIGDLVERGTRWVQLDSLSYNQVFDDEFRAATGNAGVDPQLILEGSVAADAAVVRAVKATHPDVTVGCTSAAATTAAPTWPGAATSRWPSASSARWRGPLPARVRHRTGRRLRAAPLHPPWHRGGPRARSPPSCPGWSPRTTCGAASTKPPGTCRCENLAISPQCGFASTSQGNVLTVDEEKRKLELVVDTAQKVWG